MTAPKKNWMVTADENIFSSFSLLPVPNSYVINRLMAADKDQESMENIATKPPTTL